MAASKIESDVYNNNTDGSYSTPLNVRKLPLCRRRKNAVNSCGLVEYLQYLMKLLHSVRTWSFSHMPSDKSL